jgi:hypothetical protein
MSYMNHEAFLKALPAAPAPDLTEKYMFLDTRKVVDDMKDLGYEVAGVRRPRHRTNQGAYALHEVEFRKPEHIGLTIGEAPRILFFNSYDGSRKAQFMMGLIRFACDNGLVLGEHLQQTKFIHMGDYLDQLMEQVVMMVEKQDQTFAALDRMKTIELKPLDAVDMAQEALALRFPEEANVVPINFLQPRRAEDLGTSLWTRWNVLQENILKGGVPVINEKGQARLSAPVAHIERSTKLNQDLWDLAERFAEAA